MSKHSAILKKENRKRGSFIEITPQYSPSPPTFQPLSPLSRPSLFMDTLPSSPSSASSASSPSSSSPSNVQQSRFNSSFVKQSPPQNGNSTMNKKTPPLVSKPSKQDLIRRETLFNLNMTKPASPPSFSPDNGLITADGEVMKHLPLDKIVDQVQRKKIIKQIYLGYELPAKKPLPRSDSKIMKETFASSMKTLPKAMKESYYQRPPSDAHKQSAKDIFKRRYSKLGIPAPSTPGNPTKPQGRMRTFSLSNQAVPLNTSSLKSPPQMIQKPPIRAFGSSISSECPSDDFEGSCDDSNDSEDVEVVDQLSIHNLVESVGSSQASSMRSSLVNSPFPEFEEALPAVVKSNVFVKLEKESSTAYITQNDMSLKDFGSCSLSVSDILNREDEECIVSSELNMKLETEEPTVEQELPEKNPIILDESIVEEEHEELVEEPSVETERMETPVDLAPTDEEQPELPKFIEPEEESLVEEEPMVIREETPFAETPTPQEFIQQIEDEVRPTSTEEDHEGERILEEFLEEPKPEETIEETEQKVEEITTPTEEPLPFVKSVEEAISIEEAPQFVEPTEEPAQFVEKIEEPAQFVEPTEELAQFVEQTEEPAQIVEKIEQPVQQVENLPTEEKKDEKKENALLRLLKSGGKKLERTLSATFRSKIVIQNERPSSASIFRRGSISSVNSASSDVVEPQSPPIDTTPECENIQDLPVVPEVPEQALPIEETHDQEITLEDLLSQYEESYVDERNEFLDMVAGDENPKLDEMEFPETRKDTNKQLYENVKRFEAIPTNVLSRPTTASQRRGSLSSLSRPKTASKIHSKEVKKEQIEEFLLEEEAQESPEMSNSSSSQSFEDIQPTPVDIEEEEELEYEGDEIIVTPRREISFVNNVLTRPSSAQLENSSGSDSKFLRPSTAHYLKLKEPKMKPTLTSPRNEEEDLFIREVDESSDEEPQQIVKKVVFQTGRSNVERFKETEGELLERPQSASIKKEKSPLTRPTTASRIHFKEGRCDVGPTDPECYGFDPSVGADRHTEVLVRIQQQQESRNKFTEEFEWTRPVIPGVEYYDDDDFISRPGSARTFAEAPENDSSDTSSSQSSEASSILFEKLHTISRPSSSQSFKKPRSASVNSRPSSAHPLIRKTYLPYSPPSPPDDEEEEYENSSVSSSLSSSPTSTSPTFISLMKKRADSSSSLGQKPSSPKNSRKIIPFINFVETESDATSEGSNVASPKKAIDPNGISTKFIDLSEIGTPRTRSSGSARMLDITGSEYPRRLIEETPTYRGIIPKFLPRPYSLPLLSKVRHGVVRLSVFMEMHLANDFQTLKKNANVSNIPCMEEGMDKSSLNSVINDENPYMYIRRTRFSTGFLICPLSTTPGTRNYLLTSARNVQSYLTTKVSPDNSSIFIERKIVRISANFLDNIEVGEKERLGNAFSSVSEVDCRVEYCGSFYNTLNVNQDWAILSFTFSEDIKFIDREKHDFLKSSVIIIPSPSQLFLLVKHFLTKSADKEFKKNSEYRDSKDNVVGDYMMCVNGLYSDREELSNVNKVVDIDDYSIKIVRESMDPMACSLAFLVKGSSFTRFEYANYSTGSFTGAPITACAISMEGLNEVLKESDRRHEKHKNLRGKSENQNMADFAKGNSCVFTRYCVGIHSTGSSSNKFHGVGCSVMNWFETFYNLVYKPNRKRFSQSERDLIELEYESYISLNNGRVPTIPTAASCKVM